MSTSPISTENRCAARRSANDASARITAAPSSAELRPSSIAAAASANCRACVAYSVTLRASSRRLRPYSRSVSSISYRVPPPGERLTASIDRSVSLVSTSSTSSSSPEIDSAASRSNCPANTASDAKTRFSSSSSSSYDHPIASCRVRCRGSAPRLIPFSSRKRSSSRLAISVTSIAFARDAANSSASGIPSSRRQISTTAGAFCSVSSKPGSAACARSKNSATAGTPARSMNGVTSRSSTGSGATGRTCSPITANGSRLVATIET